MMRVDPTDVPGQLVDELPGRLRVRPFQVHFIAQGPHEEGGVVFVGLDPLQDLPGLVLFVRIGKIGGRVVGEPDAGQHAHPAAGGALQDAVEVLGRPGPDRIGPQAGRRFQTIAAADAFDVVGPAFADQLKPFCRGPDFDPLARPVLC